MNKNELIAVVAKATGNPKTKIGETLDCILEQITKALEDGDNVSFLGFGTFKAKDRAERKGRNPRTKEEITIPARTVPEFKASSRLKERVDAAASANKDVAKKK